MAQHSKIFIPKLKFVLLLLCVHTFLHPAQGQEIFPSYCGIFAPYSTHTANLNLASANLCPQPNFDYNILYNLQQHRTPIINRTMLDLSSTVFFVPIVPASMALIGWTTADNTLLINSAQVSGALVLTAGLSLALKSIIARPRPYETYADKLIPITTENNYSFPSAHTSFAFATATSLVLQYPKWYVAAPAFAWASMVGFSRMYLGVHYPTDVFCGALIGALSAGFTYWLQQRYLQSHPVFSQKIMVVPLCITF